MYRIPKMASLNISIFNTMFLMIAFNINIYAQSIPTIVRMAGEPINLELRRAPVLWNSLNSDSTIAWQDISNLRLNDDQYTTITLLPGEVSDPLTGSRFEFYIPKGAKVNGIELRLDGHIDGLTSVLDKEIRIFTNAPNGENKANRATYGQEWPTDTAGDDHKWTYGSKLDTWNKSWQSNVINKNNFGFLIQISNPTLDTISVQLDHVDMKIHYLPMPTFCETECMTFYVDPEHYGAYYEWDLSKKFMPVSNIDQNTISIKPLKSTSFGVYNICATIESNNGNKTHDCLSFRYTDCSLGSVGNMVWNDENQDGIQSQDEQGLESVVLRLYDESNVFIKETTTDFDGEYKFENLEEGYYYIVMEKLEGFVPSLFNSGSSSLDSDLLLNDGDWRTYSFHVALAQDREDLDMGVFSDKRSISGTTWFDESQDGVLDIADSLFKDITVRLYHADTLFRTTTTDDNGAYVFSDLESGEYYVDFSTPDYNYSMPYQGIDTLFDSDVTGEFGEGTTKVIVLDTKNVEGINAGFVYPNASISGYVWLDKDENGMREEAEQLVVEALVILKLDGEIYKTTSTDVNGYYSFNDLPPNDYVVVFVQSNYGFSSPFLGTDILLDSDVTEVSGSGSTNELHLIGVDIKGINAGLISLLGSISGTVWEDKDANGIKDDTAFYEGIEINLYHADYGFFGFTQSDENGDYLFEDLIPGDYHVEIVKTIDQILTDYHIPLDSSINSDFVTAGDTIKSDTYTVQNEVYIEHVDAGFYEFSEIGNYVWIDANKDGIQDASEPGLGGVAVGLGKMSGEIIDTVFTDENGFYLLDSIVPGNYIVGFILPINYIFSQADQGEDDEIDSDVIISEGNRGAVAALSIKSGSTDLSIDAGILFELNAANVITGIVWNDSNGDGILDISENGINDVWVYLYNDSGIIIDSVQTSNSPIPGSYIFTNIPAGNYYVQFDLDGLGDVSPPHQGSSENLDSDVTGSNGTYTTDIITIDGSTTPSTVNAGVHHIASIEGYAWKDLNNNDFYDENNKGFNDVLVRLIREDGSELSFTFTKNDDLGRPGYYKFDNLTSGEYIVKFEAPFHTVFVMSNIGNFDTNSDVDHSNGLGTTPSMLVIPNAHLTSIDAGFREEPGIIGNRVWVDCNRDNIYNEEEEGLNEVLVELFNFEDILIQSTTTQTVAGVKGAYTFDNVESGTYYVVYTIPTNYKFVEANIGGNDGTDSDVTNNIKYGATNMFDLGAGETDNDIDAGIYGVPSISGLVWNDTIANDIRTEDEPLVADIKVYLYNDSGIIIDTTYTAEDGTYLFDSLAVGEYQVSFEVPGAYKFGHPDIGDDDDIDSDVSAIGSSDIIELSEGCPVLHLDAAIVRAFSIIGTRLWKDINNDGIQDKEELPFANVDILLLDENGTVLSNVVSDNLGRYTFNDLENNNYFVKINAPEGYSFSPQNMGANSEIDSDVNNIGESKMLTVTENTILNNIDIGLVEEENFLSEVNQELVFPTTKKNTITASDVFPVPAVDYCQIVLFSAHSIHHVKYKIFDAEGVLKTKGLIEELILDNNQVIIDIDMGYLFSGIYYVQIEANGQLINRKIIIIQD